MSNNKEIHKDLETSTIATPPTSSKKKPSPIKIPSIQLANVPISPSSLINSNKSPRVLSSSSPRVLSSNSPHVLSSTSPRILSNRTFSDGLPPVSTTPRTSSRFFSSPIPTTISANSTPSPPTNTTTIPPTSARRLSRLPSINSIETSYQSPNMIQISPLSSRGQSNSPVLITDDDTDDELRYISSTDSMSNSLHSSTSPGFSAVSITIPNTPLVQNTYWNERESPLLNPSSSSRVTSPNVINSSRILNIQDSTHPLPHVTRLSPVLSSKKSFGSFQLHESNLSSKNSINNAESFSPINSNLSPILSSNLSSKNLFETTPLERKASNPILILNHSSSQLSSPEFNTVDTVETDQIEDNIENIFKDLDFEMKDSNQNVEIITIKDEKKLNNNDDNINQGKKLYMENVLKTPRDSRIQTPPALTPVKSSSKLSMKDREISSLVNDGTSFHIRPRLSPSNESALSARDSPKIKSNSQKLSRSNSHDSIKFPLYQPNSITSNPNSSSNSILNSDRSGSGALTSNNNNNATNSLLNQSFNNPINLSYSQSLDYLPNDNKVDHPSNLYPDCDFDPTEFDDELMNIDSHREFLPEIENNGETEGEETISDLTFGDFSMPSFYSNSKITSHNPKKISNLEDLDIDDDNTTVQDDSSGVAKITNINHLVFQRALSHSRSEKINISYEKPLKPSSVPVLLGGKNIDYLGLARQYKEQRMYRTYPPVNSEGGGDSRIKIPSMAPPTCVLCRTNEADHVTFPCEHRAICQNCIKSEKIVDEYQFRKFQASSESYFCNCPLCGLIIKKILPYNGGKEIQEYWDWVYENKIKMPRLFLRTFKHSEPVIRSVYLGETVNDGKNLINWGASNMLSMFSDVSDLSSNKSSLCTIS